MISKIGIVGVGQGGSNAAFQFEKRGFKTMLINSSQEDLSTIPEAKYTYHLPGGKGCAHERAIAKELAIQSKKPTFQRINDYFADQDVILFISTGGGGTGAGAGPEIAQWFTEYTEKIVLYACFSPAMSETPQMLQNWRGCLADLSKIEGLGNTFIIENDKMESHHLINAAFADKFIDYVTMTKHVSTDGNIDVKELYKLLGTRGATVITTVEGSQKNQTQSVIQSWKNNIFAPIENDKVLVYMGLSLNGDIEKDTLIAEIGYPVDIFKNKNPEKTITVLTGLNFPKSRIELVKEKVSEKKGHLERSLNNQYELEFDNDDSLIPQRNKGKKKSLADILG